jgi:hypothetical protein
MPFRVFILTDGYTFSNKEKNHFPKNQSSFTHSGYSFFHHFNPAEVSIQGCLEFKSDPVGQEFYPQLVLLNNTQFPN